MNTPIGTSLLVRTIFSSVMHWLHNLQYKVAASKWNSKKALSSLPENSIWHVSTNRISSLGCHPLCIWTLFACSRQTLKPKQGFSLCKGMLNCISLHKDEKKNSLSAPKKKKKTVQVLQCKHNLTHAKNCLKHWRVIDLLPGADNSLGNSLLPYVAIEQKYLLVVISDDKGSRVSLWARGEGEPCSRCPSYALQMNH